MAVAFRAAATGTKTATSGLNLVINVPAGTTDGDVMIAFVVTGTATTAATQASWTTLDTQTGGPTVRSFWKIASSEPASYTFTVVDAQGSVGVIATYSGTHATTPVDQHSAWNRLTSTTSISATTVTPSVDNCMIVFLGGMGAAASATAPGGYTERADQVSPGGQVAELAELLQTTATATGTVTGTSSASTNTQGSVIALMPPAASGTTYQKAGDLLPAAVLAGADAFTSAETGSLTPDTSSSGADAFTASRLGSVFTAALMAGPRARDRSQAGSVTPDTSASGADAFFASEAGALMALAAIAGGRTATFNRRGAVTTNASLAGFSLLSSAFTLLDPIYTGIIADTVGGLVLEDSEE